MYSRTWTKKSTKDCSKELERLQKALREADAVVVGAGAGLSAAAGFSYSGARFEAYFSDFAAKYGFHDMYMGGFYEKFLRTRKDQRIVFLELGVGYNTPVIIKYPFWRMTERNPKAVYASINLGEAITMREIETQSVLLDMDIGEALRQLTR